jgi:hypothetical protein
VSAGAITVRARKNASYKPVVTSKGGGMLVRGYRTVLCVISFFGSLLANVSMDPLWIYKDLPDSARLYGVFAVYDTSRSGETGDIIRTYPADTGDRYDGAYINFNYRFTADTLYVIDKFGGDTLYKSYRPGYAGFKIDWDNGVTGFSLAKYTHMIFAHTGPLPGHKVTVRFGYNGGCGTPTTFQTIGSFAASAVWKIDSIPIPDSIRNVPDSVVKARSYYELQVLINNANPGDTNKSSAQGLLKLDDIGLAGRAAAAVAPGLRGARAASNASFIPTVNGSVRISAFSLKGGLLFTTAVEVEAGRSYTVSGFLKKHAPVSPPEVRFVKIKGAGVDVIRKVR